MIYTDIAHDCDYAIWLWHYDTQLVCIQARGKKRHDYDYALASGRVDPVKKVGSIGFDPIKTNDEIRKSISDELVSKFLGVKFYVFGSEGTLSLQEYYNSL